MLTGVLERSLVRFRTGNLHENSTPRKVRSDKLEVDDFDRCVIRRTIRAMTCWFPGRRFQQLKHCSVNCDLLIRSTSKVGENSAQAAEKNEIHLEKMFKQSKDSHGKI